MWIAWIMSKTLCDSKMDCGLTEGQCPSPSVSASVHHWKWRVEMYFQCCDEWCFLSHQSRCTGCLTFSLFYNKSKRPEDCEESIFVRHKDCGYRLRDNVHFHMYISTSPCGDGRLNSPYEINADCKTLGMFRCLFSLTLQKIEKFSQTWFSLAGFSESHYPAFFSRVKRLLFFPCPILPFASLSYAAMTSCHFVASPLKISHIRIFIHLDSPPKTCRPVAVYKLRNVF